MPLSSFEPIEKPEFTGFSDSETRFERIRAQARYDPVICSFWNDQITLLDGHHRMFIIAKERGDQTIKALVGFGEPVEDDEE